jgi:hypothetical protein
MTDKRIAAELGRSVTQIRWKMQDIGLIGVRDLSKLAKITAAESTRPKAPKASAAEPSLRKIVAQSKMARQSALESLADQPPSVAAPLASEMINPQAALDYAIKACGNRSRHDQGGSRCHC